MSCLHYSGRKSVFLIRINGHLVQCRPLMHSLEALYTQHARNKPFVFLVRPTQYDAVGRPPLQVALLLVNGAPCISLTLPSS